MPQQLTWSYKKLDPQSASNDLANEMARILNEQFSDYNPLLVKTCMSNFAGDLSIFGGSTYHNVPFLRNIVPHIFYPNIRVLSSLPSIGSTDRWLSISKSTPEGVVDFLNNKDPNEALYAHITHSFDYNYDSGLNSVLSIKNVSFQVTYPEGAR